MIHAVADVLLEEDVREGCPAEVGTDRAPQPSEQPSRRDLNDITLGNNSGFEAGPGSDPVTGLGPPKMQS